MHGDLVGKKAAGFTLKDSNGEDFTFTPGTDPTIIFFYPKSGTYGCTKEACQFRDALSGSEPFKHANVKVIGISGDPHAKQKQFVSKYNLNYPILSDEDGEVRKAYDVGKALFGLSEARTTYVIDKEGIIRDTHDTLMNFGSHAKFASEWVGKLGVESEATKVAAAPIGEAKDLQVPVN